MEDKLHKGGFAADHLVLRVTSLAASEAHYAALLPLLGFAPDGARSWRNRAGFTVQLSAAAPGTAPYDRRAPGLNHFAFRADSEAALEQVRIGLAAAGRDVPEIFDFPEARALFVADPDGIRLEISHAAAAAPGGAGE